MLVGVSVTVVLSGVATLRRMTAITGAVGVCRVQRLVLPDGGGHTWTVLGSDHRPVAAAEDYLEYLRAQQVSPNTVKSYARALALWAELCRTATSRRP